MFTQKINNKFIIYIALILSVSSCMVKTAKVPKKQIVVVYSDCLNSKDLHLFKSFRKKQKISVKIINLPTDSIIYKLKKDQYNTTADVVILKSLFGIYKAQKADLFQPWKSWKMNELINKNFKSPRNTWFGIGIEPYIFIAKNDTISTLNSIGDLLYQKNQDKWSTDLENSSELVPLIAPILQNKKRSESLDWMRDFTKFQHQDQNKKDKNGIPKMTTDVLLTTYGSFVKMSERNDSLDSQLKLIFSNQKKKGAFFNLHCTGIVKQARNYENAKLLIEYISTNSTNEKLNNLWKTFPIGLHKRKHNYAYQNTFFKIYPCSINQTLINYKQLNKTLKKVKN